MNYVRDFQEKHGLVADGILGPKTANKMREVWCITSEQCAHYLGQGFVDTKGFTRGREILNYDVQGLMKTYNFYRDNPDLAIKHGRNAAKPADQVAIANIVYDDANRSEPYKLGNTRKGDGWNNRGVGLPQLTGRANIEAFLKWKGLPLDTDRDKLQRDYFWETGLFYFGVFKGWKNCDRVTEEKCKAVTKMVQGGDRHLAERTEATFTYYKYLKR